MNVLSLFDGMSCGQVALERAGIKVDKYYASEIDKYAIQIAQKNYPGTVQLGDMTKWKEWNIDLASIDLLTAGFPCQAWSMAGKQNGDNDPRGVLVHELIDIWKEIKKHNPNVKFLFENVRMKKEFLDYINNLFGVEPISINSDLFVQQNRGRCYWTNIEVDEALLPARRQWDGEFYQWRRNHFRKNKSGVCPCLTANMGTGGHNVPLHSENLKDKLTPEECEALQSVPYRYTEGVSDSQRYKMIGNGWTVDVIAHIFKNLNK